ncbi:MAG: DUF3347 domain-containing protein [Acidobacteria bacterium]|nr:DUF3347 domain-containing protein [Acidobacteriota bacterium]
MKEFFFFFLMGGMLGAAGDNFTDALFHNYFLIQENLSKDATEGNKTAAAGLIQAASKISPKSPEQKKLLAQINQAAAEVAGENLDKDRSAFGSLSKFLQQYLAAFAAASPYPVYHCSMINKTWIQREKGIKNPYYGKKMLTCGEQIKP